MWTRVFLLWLSLHTLVTTTLSQDTTLAGDSAVTAEPAVTAGSVTVAEGSVTVAEGSVTIAEGAPAQTDAPNVATDAGTAPGPDQVTESSEVVTEGQAGTGGPAEETVTEGEDASNDTVVGGDVSDLGKEDTGGGDIGDNGEEEVVNTTPGGATTAQQADTGVTDAQDSGTAQPAAGSTALTPGEQEATAVAATAGPPGGEQVTDAPTDPTTTVSVATTTLRTWPADDPCRMFKELNESLRHYTHPAGAVPLSDANLADGWYGFNYLARPAVIPHECIKEKYCSTIMPYHLQEKVEPAIGDTEPAKMCGPGRVAGETGCCLMGVDIQVKNCQTRYIYNLTKVILKSASICIRLPDEEVPFEYLAIPPTYKTTTTAPTTPRPTLANIHHSKLVGSDGIVTVEYAFPQKLKESNFLTDDFDDKFRQMIADALNNMTFDARPTEIIREGDSMGPGVEKTLPDQVGPVVKDVDTDADFRGPEETRRRREAGGDGYTKDNVKYVGPTPRSADDTLQVAIFVEGSGEKEVVPTDHMMQALKNLEQSGKIGSEVNLTMLRYYEGLPADIAPVDRSPAVGMWDRHRGLLIALIVLTSICLLIILIGLCCLKCRKSRGSWTRDDDKVAMEAGHPKKRPPMVMENPLPDSEIMRDEAPMTERDNPAMTSNGGGGHLSKEDNDNGWVVPLDQAIEKPEVEDTKL